MTNALFGLNRPVGKGPRRLPRKSSTTPRGAAIFMSVMEANKLYGNLRSFPAEMMGCVIFFHCDQWRKTAENNIIFLTILVWLLVQIYVHQRIGEFHYFSVKIGLFPTLLFGHLQNPQIPYSRCRLQPWDERF